mmetsp:Transcript_21232/g.52747  ORF Transcript_21232/g.52747 Transcript_21232/m.52747 type:complete len:93 (+) Transcript_21232:358-636(+)
MSDIAQVCVTTAAPASPQASLTSNNYSSINSGNGNGLLTLNSMLRKSLGMKAAPPPREKARASDNAAASTRDGSQPAAVLAALVIYSSVAWL